jgi:peroxiredoxin Q/BCP
MSVDVGAAAPAFQLLDQDGETFDLAAQKGRWVVVYFYPKDSTPGCTVEACDFRDNFRRLEAKGAVVVGISRDSAKSHRNFAEKQSLPFRLLVDDRTEVCQLFGIWKLKKFMGRESLGIVRSTFLVDPKGKIARVWSPVSVKGHVAEVLAAIP